MTNKRKIINDPVYGFIDVPGDFVYDLISHPWVQRLRNIKQLGLTSFVYPGATHTRFQHALGVVHLMDLAIRTLRRKGVFISPEEEEATYIAILLHDIGHGPFSHALERSIISGITHEDISMLLMSRLNEEFNGRLTMAIEIFSGLYRRRFLNELTAGQIDMDRLDYLRRDSFYTGVIEGAVGSDRIIRMLNVVDDRLAIDEKGIYSLEKFLIARRLMYWQVYMHKTVISSESLLVNILRRAKQLAARGEDLYATPALRFFLYNDIRKKDLSGKGLFSPGIVASNFTRLDDSDILTSSKYWSDSSDFVLSDLSRRLLQRDLFSAELQNRAFQAEKIAGLKNAIRTALNLGAGEEDYFVYTGEVSNLAYAPDDTEVKILVKSGETSGIQGVSDIFNHRILSERITKHFLCYPKEFRR